VGEVAPRGGRFVLLRGSLAVAGAWLPSVFQSAVLLPQQVESLVGGPGWPATYAAVSAAGWSAVVVALTSSGRLQDAGRIGGPGDRRTLPVLTVLTLVAGGLISQADSVGMLAVVWTLGLVPSAAAVTLLAARLASDDASGSAPDVVTVASAIGAAPLVAVLLGSVLIQVAPVTGSTRSALVGAVAAGLMLLGMDRRGPAPRSDDVVAAPLPPLEDPVVRTSVRRHARLLAGVALVDTGTVTLTFSIVPLVFLLPRVADPGGYAELLVLGAAVGALVAVWATPLLPGLRAAPRRLFVGSGCVVAISLAASPFAGPGSLAVLAGVAGVAVGASNAATFGVFLSDPSSRERRATGLGLLNAMPSIPAVVVPLLAAPLLRAAPASGLTVVMLVAAGMASAGALIGGAVRPPRSGSR
jgi:hypothetical protein